MAMETTSSKLSILYLGIYIMSSAAFLWQKFRYNGARIAGALYIFGNSIALTKGYLENSFDFVGGIALLIGSAVMTRFGHRHLGVVVGQGIACGAFGFMLLDALLTHQKEATVPSLALITLATGWSSFNAWRGYWAVKHPKPLANWQQWRMMKLFRNYPQLGPLLINLPLSLSYLGTSIVAATMHPEMLTLWLGAIAAPIWAMADLSLGLSQQETKGRRDDTL